MFLSCKQQVVYVQPGHAKFSYGLKAGHSVGDILLSDGTWVRKNDISSLDAATLSSNPAIGILVFGRDGKAYCVSPIMQSLQWAKNGSKAASESIDALIGNVDDPQNTGEGILSKLGEFFFENSSNSADFPAFVAAYEYDVSYKSNSTKGKWFLPSSYELSMMANEITAIDQSRSTLYSFNNTYSPGFSNRWLLSCNQSTHESLDVKDRVVNICLQKNPSTRVSNNQKTSSTSLHFFCAFEW